MVAESKEKGRSDADGSASGQEPTPIVNKLQSQKIRARTSSARALQPKANPNHSKNVIVDGRTSSAILLNPAPGNHAGRYLTERHRRERYIKI